MAAAAQPSEKSDGLVFHPMDQFIVEPLFGSGPIHWYTVTNVTLWMGLSVVCPCFGYVGRDIQKSASSR